MRPFHSIYNKVLVWSSSRFAILWLSIISFLESIILPLPLQDLLLASMSLRNRSKAFYFAAVCTFASVLGAILGYFIGVQAENYILPILVNLGYESKFNTAQIYFQTYGIYIILIAGFSPIPYKVFTIAAGMMSMALFPFIVFSLIARGARYFLISFLVRKFGKMADAWLNKYIDWLGYFLIIAIALFLWYEY
ncbi:VTT domain-containing protein [Candidatus Pseudothioglobus singularis]|jgi:membrane protein YqaA with SNARE-associated domain|nr:VTT domain-containing protein [Candidatus Pseudothioglobus singularis]MDA7438478.1 VTT domain-containing protein [Candidatus Pseudothioglobus singularis]MDA8854702.1 VTT domain-containing protein [Candidatus Pseudothioglobus singularis]MDB0021498.1 VTT domain-containing protein [Candidatus Pseudothioglobus singularis]MDC0596264.1 VTT domain-containing protein [Candidatus Pseudothioglobus singularis]MDC3280537.1 VTT domain-containing protein [Candidatus Pseudothioglobus singularis]